MPGRGFPRGNLPCYTPPVGSLNRRIVAARDSVVEGTAVETSVTNGELQPSPMPWRRGGSRFGRLLRIQDVFKAFDKTRDLKDKPFKFVCYRPRTCN